jgi:hypothetical protein
MSGNQGSSPLAAVRITVGQSSADARTVLPATPTFTKYLLSFAPNGSQAAVANKEITESTTEIFLEAGSWTITAKGYAMFNGTEAIVAEGSTTITALSGKAINAAITIGANIASGKGILGYTISAPQGIGAYYFALRYRKVGETINTTADSGAIDTNTAPFSKTGNLKAIESGYYIVTASVDTSFSTTAIKSEVVHIYPNMSSNATFAFSAADFVPMIRVSGKLTATSNSATLSTQSWSLSAYTNKADSGSMVGTATISGTEGDWQFSVAAFETQTPVYIKVTGKDASANSFTHWIPNPIQVGNTNLSSVALSCDLSLITLSGTFAYKNNGTAQTIRNYTVEARTDISDLNSVIARAMYSSPQAAWALTIPAFATDTPVYFYVSGTDSAGTYFSKYFDNPVTVGTAAVANISLALAKSTIGGTLSVTINGTAQNVKGLSIGVYTDQALSKILGYGYVAADDGKWSMQIDAPAASMPIYFRVTGNTSSGQLNETIPGSWDVTETGRTDINLSIVKSFVTLSGAATVKLDGATQSLSDYYIHAYSGGSYVATATLDIDGTWKITTTPQATPRDMIFIMRNKTTQNTVDIVGPYSVSDKDISGIAIAPELMTLRGTLTAAFDGAAQKVSGWRLSLASDSTYYESIASSVVGSDGSWSMTAKKASTPTPFYFSITTGEGYFFRTPVSNISTANAQSVSIALNATTATLKGM